jgi:hypothetical protein
MSVRFPFDVIQPQPDEALDSYLSFLAEEHLGGTIREMVAHLGLELDDTPYRLVREMNDTSIDVLARATGLQPQQVIDMTLVGFKELGIFPPRSERRGNFRGAWAKGSGSYVCPRCLRSRRVRWRRSWFSVWTVACLTCGIWLATACPACGRQPRTRRSGPFQKPVSRMTISCPVGCASEALEQAPETPLPEWEPLRESTAWLQAILAGEPTVPAFDRELPSPLALNDCALLTRFALRAIDASQLGASVLKQMGQPLAGLPTELARALAGLRDHPPESRFGLAQRNPHLMAYAYTVAVRTLLATEEVFEERFSWVPDRLITSWGSRGGEPPSSLLVAAVQNRRRLARNRNVPRARLSAVPIYSTSRRRVVCLDPSLVPASLWAPAVAAMPDQKCIPAHLGPAILSIALLAIGRNTEPQDLSERLGLGYLSKWGHRYEAVKRFEFVTEANHTVLSELQLLLLETTPPINYHRRRVLFPPSLELSGRKARRVARAAELPLTLRFTTFSSWAVYEILTGGDQLLRAGGRAHLGGLRVAYQRWCLKLGEAGHRELLCLAEGLLMRHRLGEPLTWAPGWDGTRWVCGEAEMNRMLPGWENVPLRAGPAILQAEALTPEDLVARALAGDKPLRLRLQRFAALAQFPTLTLASQVTGVQQNVYSGVLRSLEERLGVVLLNRAERRHSGSLTEAGAELLDYIVVNGLHAAVRP